MSKCQCWSCVIGRALRRARWLFTRKQWQQIDGAMCSIIERSEMWGMDEYDAERGKPVTISGRRYAPEETPCATNPSS